MAGSLNFPAFMFLYVSKSAHSGSFFYYVRSVLSMRYDWCKSYCFVLLLE